MRSVPAIAGRRWPVRLAWLALYWLAGVAAMALVAFALRALMHAVGLVS
jgi:hypothetical protein